MKRALVLASLVATAGVVLALGGSEERVRNDAIAPRATADEPRRSESALRKSAPRRDEAVVPGERRPAPPVVPVRVRTVAPDERPAPHVAFELYVRRRTHDEVLHRGHTGADGVAELALEAPPELEARAVVPGCQQFPSLRGADEDARDGLELVVPVHPGATARGRVVDAAGEPADATVTLHRGRLGVRAPMRLLNVCCGRFEIHFHGVDVAAHDGVRLIADAGEAGSGSLDDVALALDAPPQELEIVVGGPGVVRGRVVDESGAPAAGLALLVQAAERDATDGRARVELHTDADGAFVARGLRDALYVVRARAAQSRGLFPHLLTAEPVRAGGAELRLVLGRPHVLVRLLDADGEPRTGATPGAWPHAHPYGALPVWPSTPTVRFVRCDERPIEDGLPRTGHVLSPSQVVFEVAEPGRWLVGAFGGDHDGRPIPLDVRPDDRRNVVELRAASPGPRGSVRVRAVSVGVEHVESRTPDVVLSLELVETASVLLARDDVPLGSPVSFDAPPGLYRVVAEGRDRWDIHGVTWDVRALGRAGREIELVAGRTIDVTLDLHAGARLDVTLLGDSVADTDERAADGAVLRLDAPGRSATPVLESILMAEGLPMLFSRFRLGAGRTSSVVPAGRYQLVATLRDGREARASVNLVAGETLPVTLRFDR